MTIATVLKKLQKNYPVVKQNQLQHSQELRLSKVEAEMLRNQDVLLHKISDKIKRSFNIEENLHENAG